MLFDYLQYFSVVLCYSTFPRLVVTRELNLAGDLTAIAILYPVLVRGIFVQIGKNIGLLALQVTIYILHQQIAVQRLPATEEQLGGAYRVPRKG